MISSILSSYNLTRQSALAALSYVAIVLTLCFTALFSILSTIEQYRARDASLEALSRLRERSSLSSRASDGTATWLRGTPFLQGQTVTLASAALLQHLTNTITKSGGSVVSTEIETQSAQLKDGYIRANAVCELDQSNLQKLLHHIESDVPFLFMDQLVIQPATGATEEGRMRVLLGVSGMWLAQK
jgi:general secretion pathway protein M